MIRAVLCDIEGTTTSLSFVHDVLFPLSRDQMDPFIRHVWDHRAFLPLLSQLKKQSQNENLTPSDVVHLLRQWIDEDRKEGVLKQIQGIIWKRAFEAGAIQSHVYPDVPKKWSEWKEKGIAIYIFSSGSIEAQQLLFRYSEAGDLTRFIDGYFDTTTGPKKEAESYTRIAAAIKIPPKEILFLSDVAAELDAAKAAGMQTVQLNREGVIKKSNHPVVNTFDPL
jgi:enolase-phosphatase E1